MIRLERLAGDTRPACTRNCNEGRACDCQPDVPQEPDDRGELLAIGAVLGVAIGAVLAFLIIF